MIDSAAFLVALPGEEPPILAGGAVSGDVFGKHVDETVSEVDDEAADPVLRRPYVDRSTVDALHLAGDLERPAEEVDVAERNSSRSPSPGMLLKDRTAVITGGAQGIGLAIASAFVAEGARVVLGDINLDAARAAVRRRAQPRG